MTRQERLITVEYIKEYWMLIIWIIVFLLIAGFNMWYDDTYLVNQDTEQLRE